MRTLPAAVVSVFLAALAGGLMLFAVAGCAQLMALTDSAAERAGRAIAEYCKLPAESRAHFRAMVAERAAPHSAQIDCKPGAGS